MSPVRSRTKIEVSFDERAVTIAGPKEQAELAWSDLGRILVETTSSGPFADDWFVLLERADGSGMRLSLWWPGVTDLVDFLQMLPGASEDWLANSTQNRVGAVWDRAAAGNQDFAGLYLRFSAPEEIEKRKARRMAETAAADAAFSEGLRRIKWFKLKLIGGILLVIALTAIIAEYLKRR